MTRATRQGEYKADPRVLYMAFEPGISEWKLAFTTDLGRPPRFRGMPARDLGRLEGEVTAAQAWFGLKGTVAVRSSCEAGRDGFWLHRYLVAHGVDNPQLHRELGTLKKDQKRLIALSKMRGTSALCGRPAAMA